MSVRRNLLLGAMLVLAVVAGFLVLRGGGEDDPFASYCDAVTDHREDIGAALSAGPTTGLLRALPSFEALADESPEDIRADWTLVVDRITALEKALDSAGVDAATYSFDQPPAVCRTTTSRRSTRRRPGWVPRTRPPHWPTSSSRRATSARHR